jgi:transcriptional regulator with XRE-family HTH domain
MERITIAHRIRTLRKRQGLSQSQCARNAGVHRQHWNRIETGGPEPLPKNLERLVTDGLGLTMAEFYGDVDQKPKALAEPTGGSGWRTIAVEK